MKKQLKTEDKTVLFAAANSGKGFTSFYSQIFGGGDIKRRYLIKGGPGTGKSTFMRRAAERAEGKGLSVEYYRCSSDPASLDAIVIEGRTAIIDATSPHSLECEIAGARDEIIDLGRFWDSEGLCGAREEIELLSAAKSDAYRGAYRLLSAALSLERRNTDLIAPYVDRDKMLKAAERIAKNIPGGKGYRLSVGLRESLGMKGRVSVDTYEKSAKKLYIIKDDHRVGDIFLAMLASLAVSKGNAIRVSYSPIDTERLDALLFEESGYAFVLEQDDSGNGGKIINMRRFIKHEELLGEKGKRVKSEYKANHRVYEGLLQSASDLLSYAGEYHFELENIYKRYMDFEALEGFTSSFLDTVVKK